MNKSYYIGWDTGAWHTQKKDGLWILSADGKGCNPQTEGTPCSTGVGKIVKFASNYLNLFVKDIFRECGLEDFELNSGDKVFFGIDACFHFPIGIQELCKGNTLRYNKIDNAIDNRYLYRNTEKITQEQSILKKNKRLPLSAIQNSIGSQASKAQHFLTHYGLKQDTKQRSAVWVTKSKGVEFTAIETYPATCKVTNIGEQDDCLRYHPNFIDDEFKKLSQNVTQITDDAIDALICALVAYLYDKKRSELHEPSATDYCSEGWIWFPRYESASLNA